jgi:indole-3-glycerol phosphate synthase
MFLERIVAVTKERLTRKKTAVAEAWVKETARAKPVATTFPFEKALKTAELAFICEIKRASPSKGLIALDFPYVQIAKDYAQAGAAALSVLTEPEFFLGQDEYLVVISQAVNLPVLRKDFIIDPYQIYEAKLLGAAAVLLIAEILAASQLAEYIHIAHSLGLSALVECHSLPQLQKAIQSGARIIGVNNRDLATLTVDLTTCVRLRTQVPEPLIFVAESGISTAADVALLRRHQVHAVLVGEALMRAKDKQKALAQLRGT